MHDVTAIIPTVGRFQEVKELCMRLKQYNIPSIVVVDGPYIDDFADLLHIDSIARVKFLDENQGQAIATDVGVALAETEKIMLIDSDDLISILDDTCFTQTLEDMERKEILFPNSIKLDGGRTIERKNLSEVPIKSLRKNFIGAQSGVIFLKDDYVALGGQSKQLESCKDWDLWIRALYNGFSFKTYKADISYSKTSDGISRNLTKVLNGRFQLWRTHNCLFTTLGRPYDWYLLLRYVAFNCAPQFSCNVSLIYRLFYPIHYFVYTYVKSLLGR
ncbi:MAG: hypothetical protein CMI02_11360 [Oceanospirillaceae bacterium]|nr:hypothetical protein [Oceanospirillaceae bacterium]MBT12616.1 hypothetical protein [Oceanospirillaceae bacterium]|tara:strand:- start:41971 stop:42792 length:822 start_codon:yes stop_codon:yes gene_type:complete